MRRAVLATVLTGEGRPSNNLFALVGDSRPHRDHNNSSGTTIYHNTTGIGWWAQNLTKGAVRFRNAEDYAVGGSTTEDLVNNQLASVIASPAASVMLLSSTNDQAANNWAASRSIAALNTAISSILAAGKFLFVIAETPRGSASFTGVRYTAQQQTDHDLVRAYLLSLRHPRLRVVDPYPVIADLSSTPTDYIDGDTDDGVHQDIAGAYWIATKLVAAFPAAWYPPDSYGWNPSDLFNSSTNPKGNLIVNGQMAGTSGTLTTGVSGSLATSFTTSAANLTGLTVTCSKVTTSTGDWQQVAITGNSGTSTPLVNITQEPSYSNFSIGDALDGRGEWEADASSVGLNGLAFNVSRLQTGTTVGFSRSGANANGPWAQVATSGRWRLPSLPTIDGTENRVQLNIQIYVKPSTTGVSLTVRFRNLDMRKT